MALLFRFADESAAMTFARLVRSADMRQWGVVDVTGAYRTVSLHLGSARWNKEELIHNLGALNYQADIQPPTKHVIPVCYESGEDLEWVTKTLGLTRDEVICAHTGATYTVFALGFIPGFAYLGWLPNLLSGLPRREVPRTAVPVGSVAIAEKQTGVYPSSVPGGWHLIGRTPCQIARPESGYFPLQSGDSVSFRAINAAEFLALEGQDIQKAV